MSVRLRPEPGCNPAGATIAAAPRWASDMSRSWNVLPLVALALACAAPGASLAQAAPRVEIIPAVAAPGETVSLRGTGWASGATLGARLYEASGVGGPS